MDKKQNRKTIIMSLIVVFICIFCLTGATFALFTNDLKDGTIGVTTTSGNVRVDIIDTNIEKPSSLVGKPLQFQTTPKNKIIYFEPGSIYYTQGFRIKNSGDISIKYRLYVSEDEQLNMIEFLKAFEIWITDDLENFENAKLVDFFEGELDAKDCSKPYYLFIKMKESATNEFQGAKFNGIGITVFAVQGNGSIGK